MAEHTKGFDQEKADFVTALLETVSGMGRVKAEQQLSSIMSDIWIGLEARVRRVPVKVREEEGL